MIFLINMFRPHNVYCVIFSAMIFLNACENCASGDFLLYDINSDKAIQNHTLRFRKMDFFIKTDKILELDMKSPRFSAVYENVNTYLNMVEQFYIPTTGGSVDPWELFHKPYGVIVCHSDSGESRIIGFTKDLYGGYYDIPKSAPSKDGPEIDFGQPYMINLRHLLTRDEQRKLMDFFKKNHCHPINGDKR